MIKLVCQLVVIGLCASHFDDALAQQPPEAPPSPAVAKPPGRLRVWVFPGKQGAASVSIGATGADGAALALATGASQALGAAYRDVPQGAYIFAVKDGEKALAQKQTQINSASFYTLAAWLKDGKWSMEIYPDSVTSKASGQSALRVLNFAGAATTTALVGSTRTPVKVAPDSIEDIKLPSKITPLDVSVQPAAGGAPARTLSEVDLAIAPAAYILVSPDYRGRLRPQIIPAGEALIPAE